MADHTDLTDWEFANLDDPGIDPPIVVDVRVTIDAHHKENALDLLQQSLETMPELISAHELVNDGFGRLVPDDAPLA